MTHTIARRLLLFGDGFGILQLRKTIPEKLVCGFVCAENRPQYHLELKELAERYDLPLLCQPIAKSTTYPVFAEKVCKLDPDLILVNSYSMLLREEILSIPKFGAINIHAALLPEYRGANPTQWALLNNATETGVTMHYMTAEFDSGDIIAQRRVTIDFEDTWKEIQKKLITATDALLAGEMPKVLGLTNTRQPQNNAQARYYNRRHPEDGRIDWSQHSALYIYNLIRALVAPHPGAFYWLGSEKIVLDHYLSLPSVVALKYGPEGRQRLESDGLALSPIQLVSLPHVADWIKDRKLRPCDVPYHALCEGQDSEWFEAVRNRNDMVIFSMYLAQERRFVGLCHLQGINYLHRSAELYMATEHDPSQGMRHDEKAVLLFLRFAFKELDLQRIFLTVPTTAEAEIRVFEKAGFVREDRTQQRPPPGHPRVGEMVVMAVSRDRHA